MAEVQGIAWHVVANEQRLTTQLTSTGNGFRDIWEVPYIIDSGPAAGLAGVARIPADQYTPDVVQATINALVVAHHGVASL